MRIKYIENKYQYFYPQLTLMEPTNEEFLECDMFTRNSGRVDLTVLILKRLCSSK